MESILLATFQKDISQHYELAQAHNAGLELQAYGYDSDLLDGDWRQLLDQHKVLLRDFTGELGIHGAFIDMSPGSMDQRIFALTHERFILNLDIAAELGARTVVFHTNFLPQAYRPVVGGPDYRVTWTQGQIEFWGPMAEEAAQRGVVIVLENMWEQEPDIIGDVLNQVDSPHLCACLDVGHFYLFSDYLPLERWINQISHRLVYCHTNNHRGSYDEHLSLDFPGGVIDYNGQVLPLLRALPNPPTLVLEMDEIEYLESSLRYLGR
ncbi:MAG: sugar phosphate isomerase/epimerase [Chloroflexi bacterium]|nr:sugar phosphate isomerase/epimerase [Chloroflexota bacterium]